MNTSQPNLEEKKEILNNDHIKNFNKRKPSWLMNDYEDDIWRLKPHICSDDISKYTVNWNIYNKENDGVFNRWCYWKNSAKDLAYCVMEAPTNNCNTTSSLAHICRSIRVFYEWLCFERECFSLSEVKLKDITSFMEHISEKKLTESTVLNKIIVISYVYSHKKYLAETFSFNPFKSKKIKKLAKAYSIQNGHTPTLYPKEIFSLLNHALLLVKGSSDTIKLFDKYMEIHTQNVKARRSLYVKFYKATGVKSSVVHKRVRALYGAAITIILILLAERKHELSLTKNEDVVELLNNNLDILVGKEMKTAGTSSGKKTERAVIQEVKDALKVILELTKYSKKASQLETILLKLPFGHSVNKSGVKSFYLTTNGVYVVLRSFAESANFTRISLRPHMFRRAYAMLWTWRYEIGDLEELKLMLKHNSTHFTQKYTEDEDIWSFMDKEEQDLVFDILTNAYEEKITLAGKMGETLDRYRRIIQAKSKMLTTKSLADYIGELISEHGLRVVAHADGFCFVNDTSLDKALCRTDDIGLDPVKRKDSLCMNCPNFAIDNSRKSYWMKRIELHEEVVEFSTNEKLIEISKQFIVDASRLIDGLHKI